MTLNFTTEHLMLSSFQQNHILFLHVHNITDVPEPAPLLWLKRFLVQVIKYYRTHLVMCHGYIAICHAQLSLCLYYNL